MASRLENLEANKRLVKWSLAGAVMCSFTGAVLHGNDYRRLLVIQFCLHTCIAAMDIGVDFMQIEGNSEDTKEFGLLKSVEVCFYKFGAFVAGAIFLQFSSSLTVLYGMATILYGIGLMVALIALESGGNQNSSGSEDMKEGKPVNLVNHIKFGGFLLTQKLFGTAFRTLLPLYIIDQGIMKREHVAGYTGTLPLVSGTLGSAFGGAIPTIFGAGNTVETQLYGQSLLFTLASLPAYLVFTGWFGAWFTMCTSGIICVLSFLGGAQTTLVFVRMAEIVKNNEFKENRNQLYCWLCSLEIIGKLTCGIVIGSVADMLGYANAILVSLLFQILTVFLV